MSDIQTIDEVSQRDFDDISPDQADTIVAGLYYAHDWLANDENCQCRECFIRRTLCTALVSVVSIKIKGLH